MKKFSSCIIFFMFSSSLFATEFERGRDWPRITGATDTITGGLVINGALSASSITVNGVSVSTAIVSGGTALDTTGSTQTKTGGITVGGNVTATAFNGDGSALTNLPASSSIQPYRFVAATAASQNGTHIGADQTSIIAISTTLDSMGGGKFILREGSFTFTAGATIPWNVIMQGQGRATKIAVTGNFNALVVSGTVQDVEFVIPTSYGNNFVIINSSGKVLNTYARGGSLLLDALYPAPSVFKFETGSVNGMIDGLDIYGVDNSGAGAATSIIAGSAPINAIINNWRIENVFSTDNRSPVFNLVGGKWKITNGYANIRTRAMVFDGASSGSLFGFNEIVTSNNDANGVFSALDMSATGHLYGWQFIGNLHRDLAGGGVNYFSLASGADSELRGWVFTNNVFIGVTEAFEINSNNIGTSLHGNVFGSSSTITDNGVNTRFRDNHILNTGNTYPNDIP